MDGLGILAILVMAALIWWPIVIWVHQLGHVLAVLLLTHDRVIVQWYGSPRSTIFESTTNLGRLHVRRRHRFSYTWRLPAYDLLVGYSRGAGTARWRYLLVDLAGPVLSTALVLGSAYLLWLGAAPSLKSNAFVYAIVVGFPNILALVPFSYPSWTRGCAGTTSDGKRFARHARGVTDFPLILQYETRHGHRIQLGAGDQETAQVAVYWL